VLGGVRGKLAALVALGATLDSACAPWRDSYEGRAFRPPSLEAGSPLSTMGNTDRKG
jgi:hypothetical protein